MSLYLNFAYKNQFQETAKESSFVFVNAFDFSFFSTNQKFSNYRLNYLLAVIKLVQGTNIRKNARNSVY